MKEKGTLIGAVQTILPRAFEADLGLRLTPKGAETSLSLAGDSRVDVHFKLSDGNQSWEVAAEVKSRLYSRDIPKIAAHAAHHLEEGVIYLVVAPRIGRSLGHRLRKAEISYADLAGRISIRFPGLTVEFDKPRPVAYQLKNPKVNPYTDKASFVVRALLEHPEKTQNVTDISTAAGLTKGWVSRVSHELIARGYADRSDRGIKLVNAVDVLTDWMTEYDWSKNRIESFASAYDKAEILERLPSISEQSREATALTLLAASDLVAPHVSHNQVHIYVSSDELPGFIDRATRTLHLRPAGIGGQFHVLEPYYKQSVLCGAVELGGLRVVSNVQLLLDLVRYPVRGVEAATALARGPMMEQLSLTPAQRDALTSNIETVGR